MNRITLLSAILFSLAANLSGQAATTYIQNFDVYADGIRDLGDGTMFAEQSESNRIQDGALLLAEDTYGGDKGTWRIPGLTNSANGWSASFKATISTSDIAADGFSFSWGSEIGMFPETGGSEDGWGVEVDHLHFAFDLFDNHDEAWGLTLGGAHHFNEHVFANVPGKLVDDGASVTGEVYVSWNPVNGASFRTSGFRTNIDISNIPTPGITAADSNVFAFSSRTGIYSSTVLIDDVQIASIPEPEVGAIMLLGIAALASCRIRRHNK